MSVKHVFAKQSANNTCKESVNGNTDERKQHPKDSFVEVVYLDEGKSKHKE
jgi:hypothetical protein